VFHLAQNTFVSRFQCRTYYAEKFYEYHTITMPEKSEKSCSFNLYGPKGKYQICVEGGEGGTGRFNSSSTGTGGHVISK